MNSQIDTHRVNNINIGAPIAKNAHAPAVQEKTFGEALARAADTSLAGRIIRVAVTTTGSNSKSAASPSVGTLNEQTKHKPAKKFLFMPILNNAASPLIN